MRWAFLLVLALSIHGVVSASASTDAAYQEAFVSFKAGKWEEALQRVDALLLKEPVPARVLELKGRILHRMGAPEKAEPFFFRALERDPELVSAHFHLGEAAFRRREWNDALQYYLIHLRKAPADAQGTLLKIVYCQTATDQLTQAAQIILRLDPADEFDPSYYFARAALALAAGREKEASDVLAQARTIYGNDVFFAYEPDLLFLRKHVTWPKAPASAPSP